MTTFSAKFLDTINTPNTHDYELNLTNLSPMVLKVKAHDIIILTKTRVKLLVLLIS